MYFIPSFLLCEHPGYHGLVPIGQAFRVSYQNAVATLFTIAACGKMSVEESAIVTVPFSVGNPYAFDTGTAPPANTGKVCGTANALAGACKLSQCSRHPVHKCSLCG
jgi:hypothetical protein